MLFQRIIFRNTKKIKELFLIILLKNKFIFNADKVIIASLKMK